MEVIVLAGGLGTRLRSVVNDIPKCMATVGGKPFLWYLLKYLCKFEVSRVILAVGYLRNVIFKWVEEFKDEFPFDISFSIEQNPLGTGGGIKLALNKASSKNIVILNGDTYFDVNLDILINFHLNNPSAITIALKPMQKFDRYGRVILDENNKIIQFAEKNYCEKGLINGGVYIIDKKSPIFNKLPQKFSFETVILEHQCKLGTVYGLVQNGYFIDIGIPEDYQKANTELPKLINK